MNLLAQLKQYTTVVADTEKLAQWLQALPMD